MPLDVTWPQALAWRLHRQLLDPVPNVRAIDVVGRLCAVQAQVASSAELAVRVRQSSSSPGEVASALADGALVKTWAMRGTLHLLTPGEAGDFLSLLAAGRRWELPSWQRYFGVGPKDWEVLRPAVREALDGRALTRDELAAAIARRPGLGHLGEALRSSWGTLLKPLAWQGDLVIAPSEGNRTAFTRPEAVSPGWAGIPEPDDAGPRAVAAYLAAYGPATADGFSNWLSRGVVAKRRLRGWFAALGDRLAEVRVEGDPAYVLAEHVDELAATRPSRVVRLLPGFDQWVLGTGTEDARVVPPARRSAVSRQAGWIAPVVVVGGVVAGTWQLDGSRVAIDWFGESGAVPAKAIDAETARLALIVGRDLEAVVQVV